MLSSYSNLKNAAEKLLEGYSDDSVVGTVVECECNLKHRFGTLGEIRDYGGEIISPSPMLVKCPRCETTAKAVGEVAEDDPTNGIWIHVFICGSERSDLFSCEECEAMLTVEDFTTGPEAPEYGWEYLACPDCEETYNSDDLVDDSGLTLSLNSEPNQF